MKQKNVIKLNYSTWFCVEILLVALIAFSIVFHIPRGVSLAFSLSFIILIPLVIRYLTSEKIPLLLIALLMVALFNCILNALLSKIANISFAYFNKLIMFFCTVVFLYSAVSMKIDETARRILRIIPILMAVFLTASYYIFGNRTTVADGITLSFVNSNFAAMWLVHIIFYLIYDIVYYKNPFVRIALLILVILCLVLVYLTYTRSAFSALAVSAILLIFGTVKKQYRPSRAFCLLISLGPVLFVLIYLLIVRADWFNQLFSFIIKTGKKLDARELLWVRALKSANNHIILGDYAGISRGSGVSQLHNIHIDVLCSYGLLPLILFVWFLYDILWKTGQHIKDFLQYIAFYAFVAVIIIGFFEAALVAGSTGLYFLSGGFLALAVSDNDAPLIQASTVKEMHT